MNEELKPVRCGCGGEAKVQRVRTLKSHLIVVMCTKCEIATNYYTNEAEAVHVWNTAMGSTRRLLEVLVHDATDTNVGDKFAKDMNVPRKGKWLWDEEEDRCYCSECGEEDDLSIDGVYMMHDFCPNCGADMRISHE